MKLQKKSIRQSMESPVRTLLITAANGLALAIGRRIDDHLARGRVRPGKRVAYPNGFNKRIHTREARGA